VARALDVVGERWTLLVVRELLLGPKRFTDLRAGLPNVSPDVLSQRLRDLEQAGVVRRGTLPPPAASHVYELTDRGRELQRVIIELGRWGSTAPFPAEESVFGVDAVLIALKSLFNPSLADGLDATYELRLDDQQSTARVSAGSFELSRGATDEPDAIIETDPSTLGALLWHGRDLDYARRSGDVVYRGDEAAVRQFLGLFPLPHATQ
jgi:DNA-binding HxlR family transcriptional regulator